MTAKAEAFFEGEGDQGLVKDLDALQKAVQTVESLGRTVAKAIPLERQAFNLDADRSPAAETTAIERRVKQYQDRKKASPDDPQAIQRATRALNDERRRDKLAAEPPVNHEPGSPGAA